MAALLRLANIIDAVNERIGRAVAWLALFMVILMFANVALRYGFRMGDIWQQELVRFMHGTLFLLAAGYTLKHDGHVRVDVFYQQKSARFKAKVDLCGTLFLLFPVCIAIIVFSADFVLSSWSLLEGSAEFHGMPGVFIFKSMIWAGAFLLLLQGCSLAIRQWVALKGSHG